MAETVERSGYLKLLDRYRNQDAVKVLIGMRRVGKSTLMRQFVKHLTQTGVRDEDIIYINMELLKNDRFSDGKILYDWIMAQYDGRKMYILIDEVQLIDKWERAVNSLRVDLDCDVYLSGSNAYLLSSDISTLITGRSIQLTVLPLSLEEYIELGMGHQPKDALISYVKTGGLPVIRPDQTTEMNLLRVEAVKSDIILKDICNRKKVDAWKIRKVTDYLFGEIGNKISMDTVAGELGMSTSTISEYFDLITDSMMFMKVERYDLKGRDILKSLPKYYCTDLGMRATQPISADSDFGRRLENIVYLELLRRGNRVYVGKIGDYEVDFITVFEDHIDYYQVTKTLSDPKVMEREMRPFRMISGRGERYIITYDDVSQTKTQDVIITNIADFLIGDGGSNIGIKGMKPERHSAYMDAYEHINAYVHECSEILDTAITFENFPELSDKLQSSFFDMQSTFKHPMVINDRFMQERLNILTKEEVRMFDSMMACTNQNRSCGTHKPVSVGSLETLTRIRDEISQYVGSMTSQ